MKISRVTSRALLIAGWCCWVMLAGGVLPAARAAEESEAKAEAANAKPPIDAMHPLYRPLELAYESREALKEVQDYQALFIKREMIDRKLKSSTIKLKLREEPFSVYLNFVEPSKGREVIYVTGKNKNQLMVHEAGIKALAGNISLDPKSATAMADNRYPVTMIGMGKMLDKIIAQWEAEGKYGETTVAYYSPKDTKLGDRPCSVIKTEHPQPRDQFKFKTTLLFLDEETGFPIGVQQYGFPGKGDKQPPLVEEYTYSQLKVNTGLKDRDFDHTNPSYAFPK